MGASRPHMEGFTPVPRPKQKPGKQDEDVGATVRRLAQDTPPGQPRQGVVPLVEDDSGHRFLVYTGDRGIRVDLRYDGSTFWASQAQMGTMFGAAQQTVSEHI